MDSWQVVWSWVSVAIFPPFISFYLPFSCNLLLCHQLLLSLFLRGSDSKATDVNSNLSETSKDFGSTAKWLILSICVMKYFFVCWAKLFSRQIEISYLLKQYEWWIKINHSQVFSLSLVQVEPEAVNSYQLVYANINQYILTVQC